MKNESTNDQMENRTYELQEKINKLQLEVKRIVNSDVFETPLIIRKCNQITILLNQIDILYEFIDPEDLDILPEKFNHSLN